MSEKEQQAEPRTFMEKWSAAIKSLPMSDQQAAPSFADELRQMAFAELFEFQELTGCNSSAEYREKLSAQQQAEPGADERDDFLNGVCVALSCVRAQDSGTLWREIVRTVGEDDLLQYAAHVEPEEWELAGFAHYARIELGKGKPRKHAKQARRELASGTLPVPVVKLREWLNAFSEEMAAYDIDPPIHHLAQGAKDIQAILDGVPAGQSGQSGQRAGVADVLREVETVCRSKIVRTGDDFALGAHTLATRILAMLAAAPTQQQENND